jgi:pyruvate/2-oxoglutarate dehydrogenase complex dihydrolipoamide acyltransferase (E2) component
MATADSGRAPDPDDWFDEPETPDLWAARVDRVAREREEDVEDWVRETTPGPAAPAPSRRRWLAVAIVAGLAVCALLGILAAAGVFSGGSKPAATPPATTTAPQTPTTTAATTTPAQQPVPVPTSTLKPGDSGAEVTKLQRALAHTGHSPGTIDGQYGPATTEAVKQFQREHGLSADGVAGPQTLAALRTAVAG